MLPLAPGAYGHPPRPPEEASKVAMLISNAASVFASAVPRVSWKCMARRLAGTTWSSTPITPCTCIGVPTPIVARLLDLGCYEVSVEVEQTGHPPPPPLPP